MPLPKVRIWTLMIIVALCTLPLSVVTTYQQRAAACKAQADYHRKEASVFEVNDLEWFLLLMVPQGGSERWWERYYDSEADFELVNSAAQYMQYQYRLANLNEHAAKVPWALPVVETPVPPRPPLARARTVIRMVLKRMDAEIPAALNMPSAR